MNQSFKHNIIFLMVAHAIWLTGPAILHAETPEYNPINFTQSQTVSRGKVSPVGEDGFYLNDKETCNLLVKEMGWQRSSCSNIDKMIFQPDPLIANIAFEKPVSDGYVEFKDWTGKDAQKEINAITQSFKEGLREQSKRAGVPITFEGWLLYPTLDQQNHILYYANIVNWDGERNVTITISYFDRRGYVPVKVIAEDSNLPKEKVQEIVAAVSKMYTATTGNTYAEFSSGDKVAAYGAMGVFASLLGVKYGKAATAGILALIVVLAKKLWFLLLIPFIFLKRLFNRKEN